MRLVFIMKVGSITNLVSILSYNSYIASYYKHKNIKLMIFYKKYCICSLTWTDDLAWGSRFPLCFDGSFMSFFWY